MPWSVKHFSTSSHWIPLTCCGMIKCKNWNIRWNILLDLLMGFDQDTCQCLTYIIYIIFILIVLFIYFYCDKIGDKCCLILSNIEMIKLNIIFAFSFLFNCPTLQQLLPVRLWSVQQFIYFTEHLSFPSSSHQPVHGWCSWSCRLYIIYLCIMLGAEELEISTTWWWVFLTRVGFVTIFCQNIKNIYRQCRVLKRSNRRRWWQKKC